MTDDIAARSDALLAAGDHERAESLLRSAAIGNSGNPAIYYNLGVLAVRGGRLEEALVWLGRAVDKSPDFALAHYNIGTLSRKLGRLTEAHDALTRALQIQPDLHDARVNLSLVAFELGDTDLAIRLSHIALEARPEDPDVFANLAGFLRALGARDDARLCAEAALRLAPRHTDAWQTLGTLAYEERRYLDARTCALNALSTDSAHAGSHFNLALAELAMGNYERGWEEYEWRRQLPSMHDHYPAFGLPLWRGEDISGKTLLVVAEQGHGDTMQFIRLLQPLKERNIRAVVMAQPALCRLLRHTPWIDAVYSQLDPAPEANCVVHLMTLPARLGITLNTVPANIPYLTAPPAEIAFWHDRLREEKRPRIGLVWAGDSRKHAPEHFRTDQRRSLRLAQLSHLLGDHRFAWYSLQKGETSLEAREFPHIGDFTDEWPDFAATAAFVTRMDLVISVDTAVAHLSAALGRPTWVLSRFDCCWRWLGNREDNPWYPGLRVFGQPSPGDWTSAIDAVAAQLQERPPSRNY